MKTLYLLITLLLLGSQLNAATSVTQHGITWTFSESTVGQFVNGDYYVVDPGSGVQITNISPGYTSSPRAKNGSMLNPSAGLQGYDGYRDYSAANNVGITLPLTIHAGDSLVSTISNTDPTSLSSYVKTAAVLTCLSSAPAAGTFRPGISAGAKTLHNVSSIDWSRLKTFTYPAGEPRVDIATYTNYFQMVFLDHGGWTTRFMRPSDGIPDNYYFPEYFTKAGLMLNFDYTSEEKQALAINYIQLGIDLYSYIESGGDWEPDGGNNNGRKMPILLSGYLLGYAPMRDIGQKSGDYLFDSGHGPGNPPTDYIHFGEDGQTFYVRQADIDMEDTTTWISDAETARPGYTGELRWTGAGFTIENSAANGPWNPDARNDSSDKLSIYCRPYTQAMLGMPEWGIRFSTFPLQSDSSWTAMYRTIENAGKVWSGDSIILRLMGITALWNHQVYFDYVDRFMAVSRGMQDPFGFTVERQQVGGAPTGLILAAWNMYRNGAAASKYKIKSVVEN